MSWCNQLEERTIAVKARGGAFYFQPALAMKATITILEKSLNVRLFEWWESNFILYHEREQYVEKGYNDCRNGLSDENKDIEYSDASLSGVPQLVTGCSLPVIASCSG